MTLPRQPAPVIDRVWIYALAVGLPLLAMSLLGLDSNWDLRNYHLYNPHAWLTGRMAIDIAPAQLQSWHNPLLDVPLYLLVTSGLSARWASAWLTLPFIASLYCLLRMQSLLHDARPSRTAQAVLALLALTGAATFSTLGLSMNDGFVAAAMLGSLLIVLQTPAGAGGQRQWLLAGLLAGAITGLKLSAAFYCIALACASLASGPWPRNVGRMGSLALGGGIGFLVSYGYWGWQLFAAHGNPFFPYYNQIFHSPDVLAGAYADGRFRATSLADALTAPLQLLHHSRRYSESTLSDPRMLLGLLALSGLFLLCRKRLPAGAVLRERFAILLAFFIVSFAVWIAQFGIYRYAIVLELIGALALVLLLQRLPRGANVALVLALLLVSGDTRRPKWGRNASPATLAGIQAPSIPDDALVLIASQEPLAYLALGLPASVPLVAVSNNIMSPTNCMGLQYRARDVIARHRGPIWLLNDLGPASGQAQVLLTDFYGLKPAGACVAFVNSLGAAQLCPQARSEAARKVVDCAQAR